MINRENYFAVREYLRYQADVLQRDSLTIYNYRVWLKHLLCWADDLHFDKASTIRPVYPRFLLAVRRPDDSPLTSKGVKRACLDARMFFEWLLLNHGRRYPSLTPVWIATLQPPKMASEPPKDHQAVTLDVVKRLLAVQPAPGDIATWRDQATAAFLFLSGMRAAAFCSLPISCVNLEKRTIMQYPTLGVKTKNKKAAVTRLFEIPDLLDAVAKWDDFIRERLPSTAPWYALTISSFGEQVLSDKQPGEFRARGLRRNIEALFRKAGLPFQSPHKFRPGHAVYGLKMAKEVSDLKAVSMNLMHSSLGITDAIYAVLSEQDMQERIARLGRSDEIKTEGVSQKNVDEVVQRVIEELRRQA